MDFQYIILAAGKGKRMGTELPKVLSPLHGKPLIDYLLSTLRSVPTNHPPIIVVGYKAETVQAAVGHDYTYALQEELLGTGHAVMMAKNKVAASHVVVINGDNPFVRPETIKHLLDVHAQTESVMTLATVTVPDFAGWRESFSAHGRILRDADGTVKAIREHKDATPEEQSVMELNVGLYVFRTDWLFEQLENIGNVNAQGEYYLTDVAALALATGHPVPTVSMDPLEALGINTQDHLAHAARLVPSQLILE